VVNVESLAGWLRWLGLVVVVGVMAGGMLSYGYAEHGWERGAAWLACAFAGMAGLWWLVMERGWRTPAGAFVWVLAALVIWGSVQLVPLPTGAAIALNPALGPIVEGMRGAGVPLPETMPLAVQPEDAARSVAQAVACLCFFLAVASVASRRWVWLAGLAAGISALEGLLGLASMLLGEGSRASGAAYNPNHHAALTLAGLPLLVALLWNRHEARAAVDGEGLLSGRDPGLLGVGLGLAATVGWVGGLSRGSLLLGLPLVVAWLVWEWWRSLDPEREPSGVVQRLLAPTALGLVLAVGLVAATGADGFATRFTGNRHDAAYSASSRPELVAATLKGLAETRFMGLGFHGAEWAISRHVPFPTRLDPVYTHNDWVQLPAELGLLGSLLFVAALAYLARQLRRIPSPLANESRRLRAAAWIGLATLLAHAAVDFHLRVPLIGMQALLLVALVSTPTPDPVD
jgi:hypothetical protein